MMKIKGASFFMMFYFALMIGSTTSFCVKSDVIAKGNYSFQWINDCAYNGNEFEIKYGINSLMSCGGACLNNSYCDYFTFGALSSICSLKHVGNSSQEAVCSLGDICGTIPSRIHQSPAGRQWQTSDDGSFKWANSCNFGGNDINPSKVMPNITTCVDYCKSNSNCNYFTFRSSDKICRPKKSSSFFIDSDTLDISLFCGFITERSYNVEFVTKCN